MLKRQHRLLASVRLKTPNSFSSSAFILKIAQNNLPESRFGFIVRKSLDKRSVKRNRVRRIFRSCVEEMLDQVISGYDMLFILQKGSLDLDRETIYQEIERIFKKKKLLR